MCACGKEHTDRAQQQRTTKHAGDQQHFDDSFLTDACSYAVHRKIPHTSTWYYVHGTRYLVHVCVHGTCRGLKLCVHLHPHTGTPSTCVRGRVGVGVGVHGEYNIQYMVQLHMYMCTHNHYYAYVLCAHTVFLSLAIV